MIDKNAQESTLHVLISGRVQGVGYRAWTEWKARQLGLSGWVRNRRSGAVEAVFGGSAEAVDAMLAACRSGPAAARVKEIEIVAEPEMPTGPFEVRPTV
ncbi:acylphosphatase [Chthonobacter albigriseus]|uniref:acylphosphatase n=1 Tax=Chthonobacter albigriseus TaxID=1683161 RepID=UPI0015EF241C|nr:acylphosphatase [Chthonobacter albigriseus]